MTLRERPADVVPSPEPLLLVRHRIIADSLLPGANYCRQLAGPDDRYERLRGPHGNCELYKDESYYGYETCSKEVRGSSGKPKTVWLCGPNRQRPCLDQHRQKFGVNPLMVLTQDNKLFRALWCVLYHCKYMIIYLYI